MVVHLIYREIGQDRHFLCWNKAKGEAAWIEEHMLEELKDKFSLVSYATRELAEDRAERYTYGGKVLTRNIEL